MSVDILILHVGIQAPDEVSVPFAEFAGLSLDLLRPSSVLFQADWTILRTKTALLVGDCFS